MIRLLCEEACGHREEDGLMVSSLSSTRKIEREDKLTKLHDVCTHGAITDGVADSAVPVRHSHVERDGTPAAAVDVVQLSPATARWVEGVAARDGVSPTHVVGAAILIAISAADLVVQGPDTVDVASLRRQFPAMKG